MAQGKQDEIEFEQGFADWAIAQIDQQIHEVDSTRNLATNQAERKAFDSEADKRIERLESSKDQVVKARIDLLSEDQFYIGTRAIDSTRPGFGLEGLAVINWQSPLASEFFYQASKEDARQVHLRRTIKMKRGDVIDLTDDVLTPRPRAERQDLSPVVDDDVQNRMPLDRTVENGLARPGVNSGAETPSEQQEQQPEQIVVNEDVAESLRASDLLLDELNSSRSLAMTEIVATIQADQDRLIRANPNVPLVVQGGPGTGKTVVALHRASWVMYNMREEGISNPNALVVGPNEDFISYVKGVLPSLGETSVAHLSINELCRRHLSEHDRQQVLVRRVASPEEAYVKGHYDLIEVLETAVWLHVRPASLVFPFGLFEFTVSAEQVQSIIEHFWMQHLGYSDLRNRVADEVSAIITAEYNNRTSMRTDYRPEPQRLESALRQHLEQSHWLEHVVPSLRPHVVLRRLMSDAEFLSQCALELSTERLTPLIELAQKRSSYLWCADDLPLLSELAHILGTAVEGYDHIVVDEAQDLSPMQWRAIRRHQRDRSGLVERHGISSGSITITGDLAQATSEWSAPSWDDVARWAGFNGKVFYEELRIGYRVPEELIVFAGRLLPVAAPQVDLPRSFRSGPQPVIVKVPRSQLVDQSIDLAVDGLGEDEIAAVICPQLYLKKAQQAISTRGMSSRVQAIGGAGSKGLEFDRVIVMEPGRIVDAASTPELGHRNLFVAMTRATKQLMICHGGALPKALQQPFKPSRAERKTLSANRLMALTDLHDERTARKIIDPNAYRPWSDVEEDELVRHYQASVSIEDIALLLRRSPGAVRSRLRKLGVR